MTRRLSLSPDPEEKKEKPLIRYPANDQSTSLGGAEEKNSIVIIII